MEVREVTVGEEESAGVVMVAWVREADPVEGQVAVGVGARLN